MAGAGIRTQQSLELADGRAQSYCVVMISWGGFGHGDHPSINFHTGHTQTGRTHKLHQSELKQTFFSDIIHTQTFLRWLSVLGRSALRQPIPAWDCSCVIPKSQATITQFRHPFNQLNQRKPPALPGSRNPPQSAKSGEIFTLLDRRKGDIHPDCRSQP